MRRNPDRQVTWDQASTFEDYVRKAIAGGREAEVQAIIETLPALKRERYLAILQRMKTEKAGEGRARAVPQE
jgi:hypothetical protein